MYYLRAKPFSSGTEYEVFRYNYCDNGCRFHKEREDDGFPEFLENGGCPIEDGMESARFDRNTFPNVLLEIREERNCINYHHCPFYLKKGEEK